MCRIHVGHVILVTVERMILFGRKVADVMQSMTRVVVLAGILGTAAFLPSIFAQGDYKGKYVKDPGFQKFLKDIPKLKQNALDRAKRRLGLISPDPAAIVIEVKDAIPENPETIARFTEPAFQTETIDAAKKSVRITIFSEFIYSKRFDPAVEMNHEIVHAVMRQLMTAEKYGSLPKWIREGLAVSEADQTEERLIHAMLTEDAFSDPGPVILGLDKGSFSLLRYGESGAAIDLLRKKGKDPVLEKFVADIVDNAEIPGAFSRVYNIDYAAFLTEARLDAAQRCQNLKPEIWNDYLELKKADKERRYEFVRDQGEMLLAKTKTGPLVELLKESPRGKGSLQRLVNQIGGKSDFWDEGLYQLGTMLLDSKDWKGAAVLFEKAVRDCPDGSVHDRGLVGLATAKFEIGEKDAAKALIGVFEKSFPKSQVADDAATLKKRMGM
jgi:hypothetical protein